MKAGTKKIVTLTTGLFILMSVFAVCIVVSVFAQPAQFLSSAALSQFFDTGKPANPYPSISGIHNGTLTPKVTIHNVTKLYTYPCPGTGGHTEHVAFYDSTTDALITEGYWNGYTDDDWHNVSFSAFTLYAGITYKFSIRTGSYPQIIHNQTFRNAYGTINCTEFIDANGRSHNNWIPALRLSGNFVLAETGYSNPKTAFTSHYNPVNITVNPCVPRYKLPLNETEITNFETIKSLVLSPRELKLLKTNGFVIRDYGMETDIVAPYEDMKARDIPIFVTADTLLHLYHIQFNEILKGIEEREFFDALVDMSNAMLERSKTDYESFDDPVMKEAARRNVAYFSVALTLLQTPTEGYDAEEEKKAIEEWNKEHPWDTRTFVPIKKVDFSTPDYVKMDVNEEIENIGDHQGFLPSYIFNSDPNRDCEGKCCYCEDYSQYVPRGHYTRSEMLKRYFKAMMWYGRMAFLLKGGNVSECDGGETPLLTEEDAKIATIQASLISSELPAVEVGNATTQELWTRMYSVTAFFVGTADDLTPYDYQNAIGEVFGSDFDVTALADDENLLILKAELAKLPSPEIYGGSGVCAIYPPVTREKLQECLAKTKGLRFMGQRFIPDSYMLQQLVSPAVGMYAGTNCEDAFTCCYTELGPARCFPRGLDVMAVLGSERAEAILREEGDTEYAGMNTSYQQQLYSLEHEFDQFNVSDWNRNLYWSWLYTLQPLLKDYPAGYPTFMQTEAWQNKGLQTALASWTELRHDTILYAKQSYTPPLRSAPPQVQDVVGYVEPVPEFYARLLSLTEMTEKGLENLDALNETEKARLQSLEGILERLITISKAELENKELSEADYEFIRDFGKNLDSTIEGVSKEGKETTIVADVHTDCNTEKVLEEGVGYVKLILVAYNVPDGSIIVGAGPVFSYYEFKQPMSDRLTDEAWKEMLQNNPPEEPEWVKGFKA
ncbi:MAG: hypothetical protein C5S38_04645 [Candidatus Methanophagaceae archaeon]|nr:MAG: hypothetical protein C5S38_04645 [Methanophagales archaeon]KAF5436320.1 Protein of unknown function (DUF3160) [Methanophagales archaeon]